VKSRFQNLPFNMQPAALHVGSNPIMLVLTKIDLLPKGTDLAGAVHVVALQVEFESQILKPVFRLIGYRLWG
jgi:hypothetical protein